MDFSFLTAHKIVFKQNAILELKDHIDSLGTNFMIVVDPFFADSPTMEQVKKQMDEMGISPAAVAEKFFGIRPAEPSSGKKPGDTLIEDAERTVRKSTEGFFTVLWEGFLDTLGNMITTGISVFGSQEGHSAKGGSSR